MNLLNNNDNFFNRRFQGIQALRGIAALFVLSEHVRFLKCGAFGVDIFFCISGFLIMYTTHQRTNHFLLKRFLRVTPLYYIMTTITAFLLLVFPTMFEQTIFQMGDYVKSLLFIPFEITEGIVQPLYRIGWTINYEIFFYIIFSIGMHISWKYRGMVCGLFLICFVGLGQIFNFSNTIIRFYTDPILLEFLFGILCYYIILSMDQWLLKLSSHKKLSPVIGFVLIVITLGMFCALAITKKQMDISGFGRTLFWGIPAFTLLFISILYDYFATTLPVFVFLGNISFSIYMVHYFPLLFVDRQIYTLEFLSIPGIITATITVAIILILAYFTWKYIETKFTSYLKKYLS